jgi:ribonuclease HIII
VNPFEHIDYGIQFPVSKGDAAGMIRIFQNKRGIIKTDFSQINNEYFCNYLEGLIHDGLTLVNINDHIPSSYEQWLPIIGTDESGKGDYFGPLVSAGVYVDEISVFALVSAGVRDSKELSDKQNIELADLIATICKGKYAIIEISPERYNQLYDQFRRENKNLNTLLAWGHAKALEEILTKVDCHYAMADQFADEKFIISKLQERGKALNLIQQHKAESNIAVAAASIIARARFLKKLEKLSHDFHIDLPKGSSEKVIEVANHFVTKFGKESLTKVAKLHFKTTSRILS